jgi:hypothetical protein
MMTKEDAPGLLNAVVVIAVVMCVINVFGLFQSVSRIHVG